VVEEVMNKGDQEQVRAWEEAKEVLGKAIDEVDNLAHALELPMPADFHVKALKESLPDAIAELKRGFVAVTGENPWN
jgi:hypothetical protein